MEDPAGQPRSGLFVAASSQSPPGGGKRVRSGSAIANPEGVDFVADFLQSDCTNSWASRLN